MRSTAATPAAIDRKPLPIQPELGQLLHEFRIAKGHTLRVIAALCGVKIAVLSRAENGKPLSDLNVGKLQRFLESVNAL